MGRDGVDRADNLAIGDPFDLSEPRHAGSLRDPRTQTGSCRRRRRRLRNCHPCHLFDGRCNRAAIGYGSRVGGRDPVLTLLCTSDRRDHKRDETQHDAEPKHPRCRRSIKADRENTAAFTSTHTLHGNLPQQPKPMRSRARDTILGFPFHRLIRSRLGYESQSVKTGFTDPRDRRPGRWCRAPGGSRSGSPTRGRRPARRGAL